MSGRPEPPAGGQFDLMVLPPSALAARRKSNKRGHAMPPGTGPAGETCKTCRHLTRVHMAGTYLKCALRQSTWTRGPGSDVRAGDAACQKWEAV